MSTTTAQTTTAASGSNPSTEQKRNRPRRRRGQGQGRGNAQSATNEGGVALEGTASASENQQQHSGQRTRRPRRRHPKPAVEGSQPATSGELNPAAAEFQYPTEGPTWQQQEAFGANAGASTQTGSNLTWQQEQLLQTQKQNGEGSGRTGGRRGGRRGRGPRPPLDSDGIASSSAPRSSAESLASGQPQSGSQQQSSKQKARIAPKRSFGGELTTEDPAAVIKGAVDVGEEEGEPEVVLDLPKSKGKQRTPRPPRGGAKTVKEAEDLMGRIHQQIGNGSYECMVCYSNLSKRSKIWNCERCYAVFHLQCIKKWAESSLAAAPEPTGADRPAPTWRCPGCQNPSEKTPQKYTCWCHKVTSPEPVKFGAPHSCGEKCGKKRISTNNCPHPCDLICHAGPCPPCTSMGPEQPCFCGKDVSEKPCRDTDYDNGWSCTQVCGEIMPCGEHTCPKLCHPGMCGDCEETEKLTCFCGRETKDIKCRDKLDPRESESLRDGEVKKWDGYWQCNEKCDRPYDCGIHHCQKGCHPQETEAAHCPFSPDVKLTCPCGKTALKDLGVPPREKCTDPVPACNKACNKPLRCGHLCPKICHGGDCGMCMRTVDVPCRCKFTVSKGLCDQGYSYEPPQCYRVCKVTLNCGRHECGERCCAGEKAAAERIKNKKRQRPLGSAPTNPDEGFESEHICTRVCGRLLKCGTHTCQMLCHRGPCGTCLEASFEELTCHCGRTSIPPPVRCGTKPPVCHYQCTRPKACSHPTVPHNCHEDEESCPKCPYLTNKVCACGKKTVKSQPCWRDTVSCGTVCGKRLSCGTHTCRKTCHSEGECEEPCQQACGKTKTCGHPCGDPCHAPFPCHEDKPCQAKVVFTCDCGGIKQEAKCGATKTTPGTKKEVKCGDQCRARRMALALEIDPDGEGAASKGYSEETIELYKEMPKWCSSIEQTLREFVDKTASKQLNFPPMKKSQRGFIHALAEDFGLMSESQDPEPYRSVAVYKSNKLAIHPRKTIAQFIASQSVSAAGALHPVASSSSLLTQLKKPVKQAVNAFLLSQVGGIIKSELETALEPVFRSSQLRFTVSWAADEDVIVQPKSSSLSPDEIELELETLKAPLKRLCAAHGLANSVELCWVGRDGKIQYKEGQRWSTVTKSASTPNLPAKGISSSNGFSALMNPVVKPAAKPKKKEEKKQEEIVDDWEAVAEEEERKEAAAASAAEDEKERESGKGSDAGEPAGAVSERLTVENLD